MTTERERHDRSVERYALNKAFLDGTKVGKRTRKSETAKSAFRAFSHRLITPWGIVIPLRKVSSQRRPDNMPRISPKNENTPRDEPTPERNYERNPVDVHVGGRVRKFRISAGMSEYELRTALGVTAEKMHAYESGAMRIGPGVLYEVSKLLNCPPTAFFEAMNLGSSAG
ncbi:MAG TPA: helix-turn-helix transcriptional regulator [Roseiarcus sp.]